MTTQVVGGFNPFEKYRQIGSFPQVGRVENRKYSIWNHQPGSIHYDSRSPITIPVYQWKRVFVPWSFHDDSRATIPVYPHKGLEKKNETTA